MEEMGHSYEQCHRQLCVIGGKPLGLLTHESELELAALFEQAEIQLVIFVPLLRDLLALGSQLITLSGPSFALGTQGLNLSLKCGDIDAGHNYTSYGFVIRCQSFSAS